MAQSPFLIDQIQIEPGSSGTRLISRDVGTGGLKLSDPAGSLLLSQMAGLRNISNVLVVGKGGLGAQYTTIQSALDVVPVNASATNPYIILVLPGRYDETLTIVRDGVRLVGLGNPEIRSALEATPDAPGATHTIQVMAGLGTVPRSVLIEGFVISNVHSGQAAVRVTGAEGSLLGDGGIVLRGCSVRANSTVGNYSLWANACSRVVLEGGEWQEASNLGVLLVREVSFFLASGVRGLGALDLRYDAAEDEPASSAIGYVFHQCPNIGATTALLLPFVCECLGAGQLEVENCSLPNLMFSGDRTLLARNSAFSGLSFQGTVSGSFWNCSRGSTNTNALAELDERHRSGEVVFGGSTDEAVVFPIPFSDGNYQVSLEVDSRPVNDETPWVTGKSGTGFSVSFQTAQTLSVTWVATRLDM